MKFPPTTIHDLSLLYLFGGQKEQGGREAWAERDRGRDEGGREGESEKESEREPGEVGSQS